MSITYRADDSPHGRHREQEIVQVAAQAGEQTDLIQAEQGSEAGRRVGHHHSQEVDRVEAQSLPNGENTHRVDPREDPEVVHS